MSLTFSEGVKVLTYEKENCKYPFVIMDNMFPDMDGLDITGNKSVLAITSSGTRTLTFEYVEGKLVNAGFPTPALDYIEERIDLNKELLKHPLATFLVECEGDRMINAFIQPS